MREKLFYVFAQSLFCAVGHFYLVTFDLQIELENLTDGLLVIDY